ncbi:MAG: MarR family transcriptional regulator [Candidatus Thermoplasmatota archaeon]
MVSLARSLRRLPVALLIAVSVSVVIGGAFAATNPEVGGLDDGALSLPAPRLGDQGGYQLKLVGNWTIGGEEAFGAPPLQTPWIALNFSWRPGGSRPDGGGATGETDELRVARRSWDLDLGNQEWVWSLKEDGTSYTFRRGETIPFVRTSVGEDVEEPEIQGQPIPEQVRDLGAPVAATNAGSASYYRTERYDDLGNCLLGGPMQGKHIDLDQGITWPARSCSIRFLPTGWYDVLGQLGDLRMQYDAVRLHYEGRETIAGHDCAVFSTSVGGVDAGMTLWLTEDLPYPLRFVTYPRWDGANFSVDTRTSAVFDLVGFQPGDQDRVAGAPWGDGWQNLDPVDLQPWGMDEAGVDQPFPASKAYTMAKDQDGNTSMLLRDHPDAYVASSRYDQRHSPDEHSWSFFITNGEAGVWVTVVETVTRDASVAWAKVDPTSPAFSPSDALQMPETTYWFESEWENETNPYFPDRPRPGDAPATGVSLSQAILRWRTAGGTGTPTTWGHATWFEWPGFDPDHPVLHQAFFAGDSSAQIVSTTGLDSHWVIHEDIVTVDAVGDVLVHRQYDNNWGGSYGIVAPDKDPTEAPKAASRGSLAAWRQTPQQAAGAGAVGLLVGLLYFLWPAIKAGPLALFSRIEGPKLLDHPVRARLALLVAANPGIHFKELRRQSGLANGVIVHHLDKLAASNLVQVKVAGRYRCYFPPNTGAVNGLALAAVKADGAQKVIAAVRNSPGADVRALAAATGLGRSTVHYHLQRLQEAGLVRQSPLAAVGGATWAAVAT